MTHLSIHRAGLFAPCCALTAAPLVLLPPLTGGSLPAPVEAGNRSELPVSAWSETLFFILHVMFSRPRACSATPPGVSAAPAAAARVQPALRRR